MSIFIATISRLVHTGWSIRSTCSFCCLGIFKEHPKSIGTQRRDYPVNRDHQQVNFHDDINVPLKWREIIDCRTCKRLIVVYLKDHHKYFEENKDST